jgi:hypothetical protein
MAPRLLLHVLGAAGEGAVLRVRARHCHIVGTGEKCWRGWRYVDNGHCSLPGGELVQAAGVIGNEVQATEADSPEWGNGSSEAKLAIPADDEL